MVDLKDISFLNQAIEISKNAKRSLTCFSVGAVLVNQDRLFVSNGFTLEFGEGWHAEAVAIKKALDTGFNPKGATIYSTMEPCSIRASGKKDCSTLLIENEIARVIFALREPPIFVVCQGQNKLKEAGVKVEHAEGLDDIVININQHLFQKH